MTYEFNNTRIDYIKNKTIHELFEEKASIYPNNIAVICNDKKLTYNELNKRSNSLARVLRNKGVTANTIVGIMVPRSIEMIVGIMAILKSGGAYMPIDSTLPKYRIEYMLENSGCRILLSNENLVDNLEFNGHVIDIYNDNLYNIESDNIEVNNKPSDLAYIIYTFGTTGNTKGVMITHFNLINFIYSFNKQFKEGFTPKDNVLSLTNYVFDVSVCEFFVSLLFGCTLVLNDKHKTFDTKEISQLIISNNITFTYIPPSLLSYVYDNLKLSKDNLKLNKLLVGVEAIRGKTINEYFNLNNEIEIINGYGPSEATICSTFYKVNGRDAEDKYITIGKTIANNNIYILDVYKKLVPIGVVGEIYISGDSLGKGYLNNPKLTEEKFIDNPFNPGAKIYKTGDLAKWLPNGNIEFIGRADNQVKLRGWYYVKKKYKLNSDKLYYYIFYSGRIKNFV